MYSRTMKTLQVALTGSDVSSLEHFMLKSLQFIIPTTLWMYSISLFMFLQLKEQKEEGAGTREPVYPRNKNMRQFGVAH